ncbi:hypothetical protein [Candidatus Mycobacterium methanotrophicum]|uniref:Uncharacterized protein n=1 Tax=Candidatus Mycobacterium methanotrophicum TaxID=2943498 RepID=A0ABY4QNI0_9MYCO|nr:hypothetical protein [Candidatus Mycobacterium methanotrophicum]UQX11521.1 hypothetical protein M5I08_03185 [Candidatus Mycobacterium methanotrophicum]
MIAVVGLLFSGQYSKGLYNFMIEINRWAIRVRLQHAAARRAPPFRLDQGSHE